MDLVNNSRKAEEISINCDNLSLKDDKVKSQTFIENLSYYWSQYCAATSIHGIQYIGERGRFLLERILWSLILVILSYSCIFLIIKSYNKWQSSPVIVSFATTETPIWNIPFPAVTICPEIKTNPYVFNYSDIFLKRLIQQIELPEKELIGFSNLALICKGILSIDFFGYLNESKIANENLIDFIKEMFDDSFSNETIDTFWLGEEIDDETEYTLSLTEEGVCASFNMMNISHILKRSTSYFKLFEDFLPFAKNTNPNNEPRRTFVSGLRGGVQFILVTNNSHVSYTCGDGVQGYKVMIHHPYELPDYNKYIRLPLDEYVQVGIKPKMITVSDSLKNYDPHVRSCYFADQRPLKYYINYTQNNCLSECLANYTFSQCNCLPFYMPREARTPICGLGSLKCVERCKSIKNL